MYLNNTKNQHFYAQAEQRLNASNPQAEPENQRVFAFDVVDREQPVLKLAKPDGIKIENNLAWLDLFSFEVVDSCYRRNLEELFGRYEIGAAQQTRELLSKLRAGSRDVKAEIHGVFATKILNLFRNPFALQKAMNTFGVAADYKPTCPDHAAAFHAVLEGSRPQRATVCARFGISAELYERWLRALFVLLVPAGPSGPSNIFENLIQALFDRHAVLVNVFDYVDVDQNDTCLLSDRGFNVPQQGESAFTFECNLAASSFATFHLSDLSEYTTREDLKHAMMGRVEVTYVLNHLAHLAAYNQRTVFQCAERVFAASRAPRLVAP
jgi:hypothetical protein